VILTHAHIRMHACTNPRVPRPPPHTQKWRWPNQRKRKRERKKAREVTEVSQANLTRRQKQVYYLTFSSLHITKLARELARARARVLLCTHTLSLSSPLHLSRSLSRHLSLSRSLFVALSLPHVRVPPLSRSLSLFPSQFVDAVGSISPQQKAPTLPPFLQHPRPPHTHTYTQTQRRRPYPQHV